MSFNPIAALLSGEQARTQFAQGEQQRQVIDLQNQLAQQSGQGGFNALQSQEINQLAALDPRNTQNVVSNFLGLEKGRQKAFFEDVQKGKTLVDQGRIGDFINLTQDRRSTLLQIDPNADTSDTDFALNQAQQGQQTGDFQPLQNTLQQGINAGINLGFLKDPLEAQRKREARRTPAIQDFDRFQSLLKTAKDSGDPKDRQAAIQFGRRGRFIKETEQEKSDIKVTETERKAIIKASVARKQGFINSGVEAADSTANIRRSIDLLDSVKTGGIDAALLRAKQVFGIESADEAELSAGLGKAILAQLKPLFGAAFTAAEGERLERIEAQFGKSTAGNKRLLNQVLKIAERAARRGLAAAEDQKDEFTANEIRNSLAFKLDDKIVPDVQSIRPALPGAQTNEVDNSPEALKRRLGI